MDKCRHCGYYSDCSKYYSEMFGLVHICTKCVSKYGIKETIARIETGNVRMQHWPDWKD